MSARYTGTAIGLHWLVALLIASGFIVGSIMVELKLSPTKLQLFSYHKWIGITVWLLLFARLAWRHGHQPPPLPAHMPGWQQSAAHWTHRLLYLLMFVIPISGWLMSSAKGFQTVYFGLLPLPDLLAKDKEMGNLLARVHLTLNYSLLALLAAHAGAAVKHHLIDKDDVLSRMLPVLKPGNEA